MTATRRPQPMQTRVHARQRALGSAGLAGGNGRTGGESLGRHLRSRQARWVAHYREALALAEPRGMRPLVAHCHLGLGKFYRRTGKGKKAREQLDTATAKRRQGKECSGATCAPATMTPRLAFAGAGVAGPLPRLRPSQLVHAAAISLASGRPAAQSEMLRSVVSRIVSRASRVKNA